MPTTEERNTYTSGIDQAPRRTGWVTMVVASILIVAVVLGAAIILVGDIDAPFIGGGTSDEDVVTESVEAFNNQDLWALHALFDPGIVVTYDGSAVGIPAGTMPDEIGRDTVLREIETSWGRGDIAVSQEILSADDGTVTASETAVLADGSTTRHTVTYTVNDDGLISRIEHVIEE